MVCYEKNKTSWNDMYNNVAFNQTIGEKFGFYDNSTTTATSTSDKCDFSNKTAFEYKKWQFSFAREDQEYSNENKIFDMRILLDNPVKYHIVKAEEQNFLILYLICEIAVFALGVYIFAYITGHYWSNRFYRGAVIDQYFKQKANADSDSDDEEKAKVSTFKQFNVPYFYILIENLIDIIYGFLCCLNGCRGFPFRQKWHLVKKANHKLKEQLEITNLIKHVS